MAGARPVEAFHDLFRDLLLIAEDHRLNDPSLCSRRCLHNGPPYPITEMLEPRPEWISPFPAQDDKSRGVIDVSTHEKTLKTQISFVIEAAGIVEIVRRPESGMETDDIPVAEGVGLVDVQEDTPRDRYILPVADDPEGRDDQLRFLRRYLRVLTDNPFYRDLPLARETADVVIPGIITEVQIHVEDAEKKQGNEQGRVIKPVPFLVARQEDQEQPRNQTDLNWEVLKREITGERYSRDERNQ